MFPAPCGRLRLKGSENRFSDNCRPINVGRRAFGLTVLNVIINVIFSFIAVIRVVVVIFVAKWKRGCAVDSDVNERAETSRGPVEE
jgi:hypothetical protein